MKSSKDISSTKKLVVFDLDGTLAYDNVSFAFSKFLYKSKKLSLSKMLALVGIYLAHMCGFYSVKKVHEYGFEAILKGKSSEYIQQDIESFLQRNLSSLFRPYLLEKLAIAKKQDAYIVLLSSSPDCIVEPIARHLDIPITMATSYIMQNEHYVEIAHIVTGCSKQQFVQDFKKNHAVEQVIAYSDSIQDLPLLESVDMPIIICPDKKLQKIAQKKGWEIWCD